jgi:hypothetical protein
LIVAGDVDNIALIGSGGGTVSGQLVTDGDPVPATPRIRITIMEKFIGQPPPAMLGAFKNVNGSQLNDDGTFTVKTVVGHDARFNVTLPDGWAVKAILSDGRDITDVPIELKTGQELTGVQVVITNHLTTVNNQVTDQNGAPNTDSTVIVFSADRLHWFDGSRFIKAARQDQQGQVQIKGLPPGQYLAVGVDYVEDGVWFVPEFLDSLQQRAQKLTLQEGSTQALILKKMPAER